MKLLSLTSFYLAILSLIIFFLMGSALYLTLRSVNDKDTDERLLLEKSQVLSNPEFFLVATMGNIPFYEHLSTRAVNVIPEPSYFFFDSTYTDTISGNRSQARYLRFYTRAQEDPVEFTLRHNKLSYMELFKRVSIATTLLSLIFITLLFLLNRFIFIRLWSSFFDTLKSVRSYDPDQQPLTLPDSGIVEFHTLNRTIEKMTIRISEMYRNLQDFTAHTTHEIQTPLAVIRTKTELLLQTPGLSKEQLELIGSISDNSRHLSQLNRSLSMLFKIGNHPASENNNFPASDYINQELENLEEVIELLNIKVTRQITEGVVIPIDPAMGAILVQNLVKNAVVHNLSGGTVSISLHPGSLTLKNSGKAPAHPTQHYFKEFVKGPDSKGLGLGLSLVRKICQATGIPVDYTYRDGLHEFQISWDEKKS
jgi:signal transduction histidine kinase